MTIVKNVIKEHKPLFTASKKVKNTNKTLSKFFNNTSMARILDIFLDNPNTAIGLSDFVRLGISRKSLENNIPNLLELGVIEETYISPFKFYTWVSDNSQAKHLEDLRDIVLHGL
jgi:hypothetical protein